MGELENQNWILHSHLYNREENTKSRHQKIVQKRQKKFKAKKQNRK